MQQSRASSAPFEPSPTCGQLICPFGPLVAFEQDSPDFETPFGTLCATAEQSPTVPLCDPVPVTGNERWERENENFLYIFYLCIIS